MKSGNQEDQMIQFLGGEFKIVKSKIINTKKLSFRKDPYCENISKYFTKDDVLYVDYSKIYYGEKDKEFYKAKDGYNSIGYVIKDGVAPV